ncbi:MAG: tail fiber domain-containing protein, partial [bacterium]|nr:tail fiber domain-containing protein [bacterium]
CITSFPQPPPTYWTASGNNIYNTNTGNVGIGTSNPTSKLHVIGDITSSAYVRAGQGLCIGSSCITSFPQPPPTYWTASGNNIYNTNTGRVGIGTSNPSGVLSVYMGSYHGSVNIGGANADLWFDGGVDGVFWLTNTGTHPYSRTSITNSSLHEILVVTNSGNVGIGVFASGYRLEVNGIVGADGYFYRSDISLKTNITKIDENILNKLTKLEPVRFKWKNSGEESVGLIAQEVEKIFPELVYTTPNGTKSIDYGKLTIYLIKAIKEMNEKCK